MAQHNGCPTHCDWQCNQCNNKTATNSHDQSSFVILRTWQEYAISTMKGNELYDFFSKRIWHNIMEYRDIYHNDAYCGHKYFKNQQLFILGLWKYAINHPDFKQIFSSQGTTTCCFKDGICNSCCKRMILFGLHNIFERYPVMIHEGPKFKLFRSEFNNTNLIMMQNPLLIRCLMSKSNLLSFYHIFDTYFTQYLSTDVDHLTASTRTPICIVDSHTPICTVDEINAYHGFEYSVNCLSALIAKLLQYVKPYHIAYLLKQRFFTCDVAETINSFLNKYCNLPHIRYHKHKYSLKKKRHSKRKSRKYEYKTVIDFAMDCKDEQHPILAQLIEIIGMFYEQLCCCYDKMLPKHKKILKKQINSFQHLMRYKEMQNKIMDVEYEKDADNIWIVACHLGKSYLNTSPHVPIYCGFCDRKDSKERNIKFKKCAKCQFMYYCCRKCQKFDWVINEHKVICNKMLVRGASVFC
eukprot:35605_1